MIMERPDYDSPNYPEWLQKEAARRRAMFPVGSRVQGYSSGRSRKLVWGTIVGVRPWHGGYGPHKADFPTWQIDGGKSTRLYICYERVNA